MQLLITHNIQREIRLRMLGKHKLSFNLLLLTALVVPYGLKLLSPLLEPYPAIIFPAGAGKVESSQDTFEFSISNIYCFNLLTEDWEKLSTRSFLHPIPPQRFYAISRNEFGLNSDLEYEVNFRRNILPSFTYKNHSALSAAKIESTRAWLRDRLQKHGCRAESLLVRRTLMSVNLKTRIVSEIDVIGEEKFEL